MSNESTIEHYLDKVKNTPSSLEFSELMDVIEENYTFTPTAFRNGSLENAENENSGSCKLFSFAQLHDLDVEETLACFGEYYRKDVLQHPHATDHQNIRNFIQNGWDGIQFSSTALQRKN